MIYMIDTTMYFIFYFNLNVWFDVKIFFYPIFLPKHKNYHIKIKKDSCPKTDNICIYTAKYKFKIIMQFLVWLK